MKDRLHNTYFVCLMLLLSKHLHPEDTYHQKIHINKKINASAVREIAKIREVVIAVRGFSR